MENVFWQINHIILELVEIQLILNKNYSKKDYNIKLYLKQYLNQVVIKNKLYKSLSNQSNDLKIKYKMINKYIKNSEI